VNPLIAVVGPTGVGKSSLAVSLASEFNGEIINADSRQVYRGMDIGTAKPDGEELSRVPHHLIDIINPDEEFSLAQYQKMASQAIDDVQKRERIPFLVGGSGLYVWGVIEGWQVPMVAPDYAFRRDLERKAENIGAQGLYDELRETDPEAAKKIDPKNIRRVIRALEVARKSETSTERRAGKQPPPYRNFIIGLTADRKTLYQRIDRRVDEMIASGFVAEVEKLLKMGYDFTLPALSSIGYRQVCQYIKGELTLNEAADRIKTETHRLVRHQNAWFRKDDIRIHWFDVSERAIADIEAAVADFIQTRGADG